MSKYSEQFNAWFEKIRSSKHSYKTGGIKPVRDWNTMLMISFVVTVLVTLCAAYFYSQVNAGTIFQVERTEDPNKTVVNRPMLDKVIKEIDAKTLRFVEIESQGVRTVDPGI